MFGRSITHHFVWTAVVPIFKTNFSFFKTDFRYRFFKTDSSGTDLRASATEAVDTGSIPGRVKPKTVKLVFTAFLLDVQQSKGLCESSAVCGRQVSRWQLDSKTERSLRCLPAKATWRIKCNYNYNYKKIYVEY